MSRDSRERASTKGADMKKLMLLVVLACAVVGVASLRASDVTTVKGFLMDVSCQAKHPGDAEFAEGHEKDCLQMCAKSGFGVLTSEGKFVKFDAEGNKKVESFVKETSADGAWKVEVTGVMKGEKMTVQSISLQAN
jgi:hypothetical protein